MTPIVTSVKVVPGGLMVIDEIRGAEIGEDETEFEIKPAFDPIPGPVKMPDMPPVKVPEQPLVPA